LVLDVLEPTSFFLLLCEFPEQDKSMNTGKKRDKRKCICIIKIYLIRLFILREKFFSNQQSWEREYKIFHFLPGRFALHHVCIGVIADALLKKHFCKQ
jgi:hypothetical protein